MELHTKQFTNRYEQCHSSRTLGPPKCLQGPPWWWFINKGF